MVDTIDSVSNKQFTLTPPNLTVTVGHRPNKEEIGWLPGAGKLKPTQPPSNVWLKALKGPRFPMAGAWYWLGQLEIENAVPQHVRCHIPVHNGLVADTCGRLQYLDGLVSWDAEELIGRQCCE